MFYLITVIVFFLFIYIALSFFSKRKRKADEYYINITQKDFEKKEIKISDNYHQKKSSFQKELKMLKLEITRRSVTYDVLKNNIVNAEFKYNEKLEKINKLQTTYINPQDLFLYVKDYTLYIKDNFEPNKSLLYHEVINRMFFKKFIPNKQDLKVVNLLSDLKENITFYSKDFLKIKRTTSFYDLMVLKSLTAEEANRIFKSFLTNLDLDKELETVILSHQIETGIESIINTIDELINIEESLKQSRKVNVIIANSDDELLIRTILTEYKIPNSKFAFTTSSEILGGAIFEDNYFLIDLSHLHILDTIVQERV